MSNRGTARLMFGAAVKGSDAALNRRARRVWSGITTAAITAHAGLWDLCRAADLDHAYVGWCESTTRAVGYVIAYAYSVETVDVPSIDVPDDVRAKVTRLCESIGCDGPPRVMLVPGCE